MQLSQKKKLIFFLLNFWNLLYILNILNKKMTLIAFLFPKVRTSKTWLDKCLKIPLSEDPSRSNMVNVPKHCWNLHHSNLITFIDFCQGNWTGKSPSYWHEKSWHCFLTHRLPMKSILFFNRDNLTISIQMQLYQKKKLLNFLLHFWNLY